MTWTAEQQREAYQKKQPLKIMAEYGFSKGQASRCIEFDEAVEAYVESQFPSNAPDKPTNDEADPQAYRKWKRSRAKARRQIRTEMMNSEQWEDVKSNAKKKLQRNKKSSEAGVEEEEVLVGPKPLNTDRVAPSKLPASPSSKSAADESTQVR